MDCPLCHQTMEDGLVTSRAPGAKFSSGDGWDVALGDLTGDSLGSGLFYHRVVAERCLSCGTVVIPGSSSSDE
jgi:hypothetical protein